MKRIYVSGPMTGIPEHNAPAFQKAANELQAAGLIPILPVPFVAGRSYEEYLRDDLKLLLDCDGIYMLPGWQESKGAKIEHMVALACGIDEVEI
jgi:hypothetical protein